MLPVNMTKVIPDAITAFTEVCLSIFIIFFGLKNDGLSIDTTAINNTNPNKLLYI